MVNPSINVSSAIRAVRAPISSQVEFSKATRPVAAIAMCECMSVSPGIRVRPAPSMTVAPGALMALDEIVSIRLLSTSTCIPICRPSLVPSKMLTFVKSVRAAASC